MTHPIDNITWIPVDDLKANNYNPNFVLTPELRLLKHSLLEQGWVQPILVTTDNTIIDGFHRSTLAKTDKDIREMTDGKVPCAVLDLTPSEKKMLTVRINRAKGVHSAVKMHELVTELIEVDGLSIAEVCKGIGATKDEVNLLMQESVFKKLDIENHEYSNAWTPEEQQES